MPPLPANIHAFLTEHHVVSLAACHEGELWSASCFYVFDPVAARLIVLTGKNTQHGRLMLHHPHIAGTIADQPARNLYAQAHPIAKVFPSDIWQLQLEYIKYTSNRPVFAHKTHWRRNEENS